MTEHYPRIRVRAQSGHLLIREGLSIDFYMRHPHREVASAVMQALEVYLGAVGPHALGLYADQEGHWRKLDEAGWQHIRSQLRERRWPIISLRDVSISENSYSFEYFGRPLDKPATIGDPSKMACTASFWLSTEYLEEHGPERVRELALEMAAPLPFCSGHAGLSFNCETDLLGVLREVRELCFRYPGMDIPNPEGLSMELGTRIRGPSWLTFLGQPVLGELGGSAGLRARLHSPDTSVEELDAERAVVTLGPWPEAGDTERGDVLPVYRELARVLEPWLYHQEPTDDLHFPPHELRRWERRFLD
jgi:hypothetical protein